MAWKVDGAPWPDVDENDTAFVNMTLAAVRIVRGATEAIREEVKSSCFHEERERAVHPMSMGGQCKSPSALPPLTANCPRGLMRFADWAVPWIGSAT